MFFDVLFQTIFSSGENDMVVGNWDLHAEDEFIVDKEIIYFPPPLDIIWLSGNAFVIKNANAFSFTISQC